MNQCCSACAGRPISASSRCWRHSFPRRRRPQPELLAHHALRGELWDKAVAYFRQAGEQALARSAHREAVAAFEQALGAVQHLPESRDTRAQAIDLRLALRNALWTLGELGAALRQLTGSPSSRRGPGRPTPAGMGLGLSARPFCARHANRTAPSRPASAPWRLPTALGDVGLTVTAQHYLGGVYRSPGDYRQAVECFQKNVACLHGALLP